RARSAVRAAQGRHLGGASSDVLLLQPKALRLRLASARCEGGREHTHGADGPSAPKKWLEVSCSFAAKQPRPPSLLFSLTPIEHDCLIGEVLSSHRYNRNRPTATRNGAQHVKHLAMDIVLISDDLNAYRVAEIRLSFRKKYLHEPKTRRKNVVASREELHKSVNRVRRLLSRNTNSHASACRNRDLSDPIAHETSN